jgi:hypothetical protein
MVSMILYDLCLPWYWEYDDAFVGLIERACVRQGKTLWQVTPTNLLEAITALYKGEVNFRTLLDRAQGDIRFEPINRWAREYGARRINPAELSLWSEDKATMHLELIEAGLNTPYTILLAPFVEQPVVAPLDLSPLGERFVIKPSNGGGGEGVILGAESLEQVLRARTEFPTHKYLIQAIVQPRLLDGRVAWFRCFYAAGEAFPCWWHPETHVYALVTAEDESRHGLAPLRDLTKRIAAICKLDWFSTEIALAENFVVVDYVNDGIDTRIQSRAADGVPDEVMQQIAERLVGLA